MVSQSCVIGTARPTLYTVFLGAVAFRIPTWSLPMLLAGTQTETKHVVANSASYFGFYI